MFFKQRRINKLKQKLARSKAEMATLVWAMEISTNGKFYPNQHATLRGDIAALEEKLRQLEA